MPAAEITGDDIARAAAALRPDVEARAEEIARDRRLPADLVAQLRRAGVFRMPMPRARGGPEMTPRAQCEVVEDLSYADPSVGWCVMIGSDGGYYSAFLDDEVAAELWTDLDVVTAGLLQPAGRAVRVEGGLEITGRWAFGSGCTHADVIVGGVMVFEGDTPAVRVDGYPDWRVVCAPAERFEILDTWYTTGLAGSGSNDYTATGVVVPEAHAFSLLDGPRRPEPLYAYRSAFFANMRGVPLGLARRAIDVALDVAREKIVVPELVPIKDLARVRTNVARAEMRFGGVRAYVYDALDRLWARLEAGLQPEPELRLAIALSRVDAFRAAREITTLMADTVGTSAIYASNLLDRLTRDAITINQHLVAQERVLEMMGGLVFGEEPAIPLF